MDEPKINEHGFEYYDSLPEGYERVTDIKEFLRLKKGYRVWRKDNIERHAGMKYLINNPYTEVWWCKKTTKFTDLQQLNRYIRDKNVYILKQ